MANAKYELFRDAKLQVFFEVQSAWFDLYKIRQNIKISEKNIGILKAIERIALVNFRTAPSGNDGSSSTGNEGPAGSPPFTTAGSQGMGNNMSGNSSGNAAVSAMPRALSMGSPPGGSSLTDLYRIQIETGDLENNVALLKNQQNTAISLFNSYLNRPPDSPVTLPDTLTADSLGVSLLTVSDSIMTSNPMLTMLQYEQQSLEARKKMVTRMGYPMIGLGINYSVINRNEMVTSEMNGKDMVMPMLTLTLPIYRRKYRAMQMEADFQKTATAQNLAASANSLKTEYYQAVQLYQDAQRRIDLYSSQSQLAGKSLDIMIQRFTVSGSGLTDILRIRQETLDYEYKKAEALADYNTAIAWLKRLMAFQQ
jgi:outer membrane protein TolC